LEQEALYAPARSRLASFYAAAGASDAARAELRKLLAKPDGKRIAPEAVELCPGAGSRRIEAEEPFPEAWSATPDFARGLRPEKALSKHLCAEPMEPKFSAALQRDMCCYVALCRRGGAIGELVSVVEWGLSTRWGKSIKGFVVNLADVAELAHGAALLDVAAELLSGSADGAAVGPALSRQPGSVDTTATAPAISRQLETVDAAASVPALPQQPELADPAAVVPLLSRHVQRLLLADASASCSLATLAPPLKGPSSAAATPPNFTPGCLPCGPLPSITRLRVLLLAAWRLYLASWRTGSSESTWAAEVPAALVAAQRLADRYPEEVGGPLCTAAKAAVSHDIFCELSKV
jgi:hypothetical protein